MKDCTEETDICLADCERQTSNGPLVDSKEHTEDRPSAMSLMDKVLHHCKNNLMMILTLLAIGLGFALGFAVRTTNPSEDTIMWLGMPGELYMRLLKMTILPLLTCSVITGASSLDPRTNGKVGSLVLGVVVLTHVLACALSLVLSLTIRPGDHGPVNARNDFNQRTMSTQDIFADLLRNLAPDNLVEATFKQSVTMYVSKENENVPSGHTQGSGLSPLDSKLNPSIASNLTLSNITRSRLGNNSNYTSATATLNAMKEYSRTVSKTDGINVLGLVTISCVFGMAAGLAGSKVKAFMDFFTATTEIVIIVVKWFFWLTPIGVASLIAQSILKVADIEETFSHLGLFVVSITAAVTIHWFITLPALYVLVLRKNPVPFLLSMGRPVSIAFASTNSAVAMPEILTLCEKRHGMDRRVTRISVPFCLTINADGSAIFITGAAFFVAQYSGTDLNTGDVAVIAFLTMVSCLAIPGIPSASIISVVIILTSMHIPIHDVALLFAVEWFLDRIRTALNVMSHTTITAVVCALCQKTLRRMDDTSRKSALTATARNSQLKISGAGNHSLVD